jgi:protein-S-isoprenylcysteine O-methyltransferase Ste14
MNQARDTPGVIAPPPLIALATLLLGLALDWFLPSFILREIFGFWARLVIGAILIAIGAALAIVARNSFVRAGTNVEPWKPALTLVTSGIFAWMRNPTYFGLMLLLAGLAIALASDWMIVLLVPTALILHFGVVKREERYLEIKFGESYRAYMSRVPRYGLPMVGRSRQQA